MNRVKWLRAKFPGSIRQIGRELQKASFSNELGQGFVLDRLRDDRLEARYFERIAFQQSVSDPFGKTFVVDRIEFRSVTFSLTKSPPELELRMPPRGLKGFTSALLKASSFSMQLEPQSVKISKWVSALQREMSTKLYVRAATTSELELDQGARARVSIKSPADIRAGLNELLGDHRYEFESVQVEFPFENSFNIVILSSDGSAKYSENASDQLLSAIRSALKSLGSQPG